MSEELVFSKVIDDPGVALERALDRNLTGTAVIRPAGTVLLDGDTEGRLALDRGVPVAAWETSGEPTGADLVAALSGRGPYRVSLYAEEQGFTRSAATVEPGLPAEVLADDPALAERTRDAAPDEADSASQSPDALAAFLENDEKIAAIQDRAREEARRRASEWGLALEDE